MSEFFILPAEDAPYDEAPRATYVDPALPLSQEELEAIRADVGITNYVGEKPVTSVRSPSSDPTSSVNVEGKEIPIGDAGFSLAQKRPRHN